MGFEVGHEVAPGGIARRIAAVDRGLLPMTEEQIRAAVLCRCEIEGEPGTLPLSFPGDKTRVPDEKSTLMIAKDSIVPILHEGAFLPESRESL